MTRPKSLLFAAPVSKTVIARLGQGVHLDSTPRDLAVWWG